MVYTFEKNGKRITKNYAIGRAPISYNGYKRIIVFPNVHFGKGCTRCNEPLKLEPKITKRAKLEKMSRAEYDAI